MKKTIALLLVLVLGLLNVAALAEERTAPADWSVIVTTDQCAVETSYRRYDANFYDAASEQPGTVVRLDYTTDAYGDAADHWVNVYLPYNYDSTGITQYNIIYFLHGTNETQEGFIGNEKPKNAIDNMIEVGITDPVIMVFPTYYYDYENRAVDMDAFMDEFRNDVMPAVEAAYSTYAESIDEAGFIASRDHRAIGGYSQGCARTWMMLTYMLDEIKWYLPFSGGTDINLREALEAQGDYDFFIYMGSGGKRDGASAGTEAAANQMAADTEFFSYGQDPSVNNFFYTRSNDVHQTMLSRYYFYNAFLDVLFK